MSSFKTIMVVLLVISLFLNVRLLTKLGNLENSVNYISDQQGQLVRSVDSQTSHIQYTLDEFLKEQSWISSIQMDVASNKKELKFQWQIKELIEGSTVVFHYKNGESDEFSSVEAIDQKNGVFEAVLPVDLKLEPQWFVHLNNDDRHKIGYEEEYKKYDLSYFVTVAKDEILKSSEITTTNVQYIVNGHYGFIEVYGDVFDGGYFLSVSKPYNYDDRGGFYVKTVTLLKYNNGSLVEEENLIPDQEVTNYPYEHIMFHTDSNNKKQEEFTSFVVRVVYDDGSTFEKEVYVK